MPRPSAASSEKYIAILRQDFLDSARDRLDAMQTALDGARDGSAGAELAVLALRRDAHNLKGMGTSFGFPAITLIGHRLEDFLADQRLDLARDAAKVQEFLDCLTGMIERQDRTSDDDIALALRSLPVHVAAEIGAVEIPDAEALLVMRSRTMAHAVGAQLNACGYRVVNVADPFEAIAMAVRTRPDIVIASATLDGVTGVDLLAALSAMAASRAIPLAILTSYTRDHPQLCGLPAGVSVIRLGNQLGDDLAAAVTRILQERPIRRAANAAPPAAE